MAIEIVKKGPVPIQDIVEWKSNPKVIRTKDFERLKRQLAELGQFKNIICIKNGEAPKPEQDPGLPADTYIALGGNQRLRAMIELGFRKVEVTHIICETKADMIKISVADNDRAAMYDDQLLAELIYPHLKEIPVEDYKVDTAPSTSLQDVLEDFVPDLEEKEDAVPAPEEGTPWIQPGDLFIFDGHRLLCGDATNHDHTAALMDSNQADLVFTDPPYNVAYKGSKYDVIMGDDQTEEEFVQFTIGFMANLKAALKPGGVFYICSSYSNYPIFLYAMRQQQLTFSNPIVWVKNYQSQGWQDYRLQHEMVLKGRRARRRRKAQPILYGWNGGKHYFADTRMETDVWPLKKRATTTMLHPTQKPIALVTKALLNSSKTEELVLDLFAGSGSTLIASEKAGRRSFNLDLDPRWCQTTLRRYANFTGKDLEALTATRRNILEPRKRIRVQKRKDEDVPAAAATLDPPADPPDDSPAASKSGKPDTPSAQSQGFEFDAIVPIYPDPKTSPFTPQKPGPKKSGRPGQDGKTPKKEINSSALTRDSAKEPPGSSPPLPSPPLPNLKRNKE